jgi:hypothetical protein
MCGKKARGLFIMYKILKIELWVKVTRGCWYSIIYYLLKSLKSTTSYQARVLELFIMAHHSDDILPLTEIFLSPTLD